MFCPLSAIKRSIVKARPGVLMQLFYFRAFSIIAPHIYLFRLYLLPCTSLYTFRICSTVVKNLMIITALILNRRLSRVV